MHSLAGALVNADGYGCQFTAHTAHSRHMHTDIQFELQPTTNRSHSYHRVAGADKSGTGPSARKHLCPTRSSTVPDASSSASRAGLPRRPAVRRIRLEIPMAPSCAYQWSGACREALAVTSPPKLRNGHSAPAAQQQIPAMFDIGLKRIHHFGRHVILFRSYYQRKLL